MDTDTNGYDLGRLDEEELFELRSIQRKMHDVNAPKVRTRRSEYEPEEPEDLARLTLEELIQYSELLRKLEGLPSAYAHIIDPDWPNGEHHTLKTPRHPKPYLPVIAPWHKSPDSGVTAAAVTSQPEPVAIAPAAGPANPVAPATPAQPEKPKRPADDVMSAARQLDSLMRFGYDLPEEPR